MTPLRFVPLVLLALASFAFAQPEPSLPEGDTPDTPVSTADASSDRIALVDLGYVFNASLRFQSEKETLQQRIAQVDREARAEGKSLQEESERIKNLPGGTSERVAAEEKLLRKQRTFDDFKRVAQREFVEAEAKMYRAVYDETMTVIDEVAEERGYDFVLRFERPAVDSEIDPQQTLKQLKRGILRYPAERDISEDVLTRLNTRFKAESDK